MGDTDVYGISSAISLGNQEQGMVDNRNYEIKAHNKMVDDALSKTLDSDAMNEKITGGIAGVGDIHSIMNISSNLASYNKWKKDYGVKDMNMKSYMEGQSKYLADNTPQSIKNMGSALGEGAEKTWQGASDLGGALKYDATNLGKSAVRSGTNFLVDNKLVSGARVEAPSLDATHVDSTLNPYRQMATRGQEMGQTTQPVRPQAVDGISVDATEHTPGTAITDKPATSTSTNVTSNNAGAGTDADETFEGRAKSGLAKGLGTTEGAISKGMYVGGKLATAGMGITNMVEDTLSGHLQGDNVASKVGDVTEDVGSTLDMVGTFIPVLEPVGAIVTGIGAIISTIGDVIDDVDDKGKRTADAQKQKQKVVSVTPLSQLGQLSSMSAGNGVKSIAGTGAF